MRWPEGEKTADSGRQVRKLRFGAGDRRKDRMTSVDGNPAVIGKPLRPVALRPSLSKGVPLLNRGQGAVRGCSRQRITSHFEGHALCHHAPYAADSGLNVLQRFRGALMAVGGPTTDATGSSMCRMLNSLTKARPSIGSPAASSGSPSTRHGVEFSLPQNGSVPCVCQSPRDSLWLLSIPSR